MDSDSSNSNDGPKPLFSSRAIKEDANYLINAEIYKQWRSDYVDELELSVWNIDMVKYALSTNYENYGPIKTAIQRGVPDVIKHFIWMKANDADKFYMDHPNFYSNSISTTFGSNVPEELSDYCPTFCDGLLGLQTDILNIPVDLDHLDDKPDDSYYVSSRIASDLGCAYNFWHQPNVVTTKSYCDFGSSLARSRFSDRLRSFYGRVIGIFSKEGKESATDASPCENENMNSSVHNKRLQDADRHTSLSEYLTFVNKESMKQKTLMNSAVVQMRELSVDRGPIQRNTEKTRQLSDTFVYASIQPPIHHSKILGFDYTKSASDCTPQYIAGSNLANKNLKSKRPKLCNFFQWIAKKCANHRNEKKDKDTRSEGGGYSLESGANLHQGISNFDVVTKFSSIPEVITSNPNIPDIDAHEIDNDISNQLSDSFINKSGRTYKLMDVTDLTILLSSAGINEVKRILWCLNTYFSSKIEFLPLIPSLCCMLILYMSPEAALCVLYRLMLRATESMDRDCGERFLFCGRNGFVVFVKYVLSVMLRHLRKVVLHLKSLDVDLAAWIARAVEHGFLRILPFDYIVRIYGDFLFEGEVTLCRYCVALIKSAKPRLLKCTNKEEAEEILYHIGLYPNLNIDQVTKLAYGFRLRHFDNKYKTFDAPSPYFMQTKMKSFYRPRLFMNSSIILNNAWETLWTWILPSFRIFDPENIYSSDRDGTSLLGLLKCIEELGKSPSPALLFIKTTNSEIIGVFMPKLYKHINKGSYTPTDVVDQQSSFVFTMRPRMGLYRWTGKGSVGVKLTREGIIVGSNNPALILDTSLSYGYTSSSLSYDSPSLVESGNFSISIMEVWILV